MSKGSADTRTPNHAKRRNAKIWRKMGKKYKDYDEPRKIQPDMGKKKK